MHMFLPQIFLFTYVKGKGLLAHVYRGSPWITYNF